MQALVTGAGGFIGRHVARELANDGWQVIGLGRGDWPHWREFGMSAWHGTAIEPDSLLKYAGRPDVIIHCAGGASVGFSMDQPAVDFDSTVRTTSNILEFIRLHSQSTRLVYPSSAAVYGQVKKLPIAEESPLRPMSPYGLHKQMAEDLCQLYSHHFGVSTAILRLFSIYGPGLRKQLLWDACRKFERGECSFFGTGEEIRDWLHVKDAAKLFLLAIKNATTSCPVLNAGSGEGVPVKVILREVRDRLGVQIQPTFSSRPNPGDPDAYVADISMARAWGWKPGIDWRVGVAQYVDWYKR